MILKRSIFGLLPSYSHACPYAAFLGRHPASPTILTNFSHPLPLREHCPLRLHQKSDQSPQQISARPLQTIAEARRRLTYTAIVITARMPLMLRKSRPTSIMFRALLRQDLGLMRQNRMLSRVLGDYFDYCRGRRDQLSVGCWKSIPGSGLQWRTCWLIPG